MTGISTASEGRNAPQSNRLASGGLIDRDRVLSFTFDGRPYQGHPGDTLASALLANGVTLVGRSFKYHRPRGILSAGPEEPNALVELRAGTRREPNTRATVAELYAGLVATSQNRWPSLAYDVMSVNGLAGPLISASALAGGSRRRRRSTSPMVASSTRSTRSAEHAGPAGHKAHAGSSPRRAPVGRSGHEGART